MLLLLLPGALTCLSSPYPPPKHTHTHLPLLCMSTHTLDNRACVQGDFHALTGSCMTASRETEKALQLRKDVVAQLAASRE